MAKQLKKGDKVAVICDWNHKGSICIRRATVHSCGTKVLRLEYSNGQMAKEAFRPAEENNTWKVVPDATDAELEAIAFDMAKHVHVDFCSRVQRVLAGNGPADYKASWVRDLDTLHEPRMIWR